VCDLDDPVATISSLVDKSLLQRRIRPDGATEFVMLESLREYAAELLSEHGEEEAVTARYVRYYADLAVLVETAIGGSAEVAWVDSVRFAQGNLRKALAHTTAAADAGLSLPLGSALGWYAYTRGHLGDGLAILDSALAVVRPDQPRAPGESLIRALLIAAVLALGRGDPDDADALTRVLAVDDDQRHTSLATAFLDHLARARGHHRDPVDGAERRLATTTHLLPAVPPAAEKRDGGVRHVGALTLRERQVARLIAGGSTNRQIGQALGIAEKTTETHVHNIIHKLGAQNRAEVAARVSAAEQSG
jgi:DNA-binding CsgD family transcriptional regulator